MIDSPEDSEAQTESPSSTDVLVPTRGIIRQVSKSRRISRRSTFRLLSVQVAEEEASRDSDNDASKVEIGRADDKCLELAAALVIANVETKDVAFDANDVKLPASTAAMISRGMERRTSSSSVSSSFSSSSSFDGPMREIVVTSRDDCDDIQETGEARRRSSDITADSLELLLNQLQQQQLEELQKKSPGLNIGQVSKKKQEQDGDQMMIQDDKQEKEQELDPERNNEKQAPPQQAQPANEESRRRRPRKLLNQLSNLKGSLISISTVVQGNLRKEVQSQKEQQTSSFRRITTLSSSSSSSTHPTSIDETETPEELSKLASKFQAMDFDDESVMDFEEESVMDSSLNSYYVRNGLNDNASFTRASRKKWSRSSFQKVDEGDVMDGESTTIESMGSYCRRRGFQRLSRYGNSSNKIRKHIGAIDVDGDSTASESLNSYDSYYIRRGMNDSLSLARARFPRNANTVNNMIAENFNAFLMDCNSTTNESIDSYHIRRGMQDSASLTRARLPRNTVRDADKNTMAFGALDMDGNSTSSESINSYHLRGGMNDSMTLTRAKLSRNRSIEIYDSLGTATTASSTVLSDFKAKGDHSLSSFEASFESLLDNMGCRSNLEGKYARLGNHQNNNPNDVSSVGSESLDLHDLYMAKIPKLRNQKVDKNRSENRC